MDSTHGSGRTLAEHLTLRRCLPPLQYRILGGHHVHRHRENAAELERLYGNQGQTTVRWQSLNAVASLTLLVLSLDQLVS